MEVVDWIGQTLCIDTYKRFVPTPVKCLKLLSANFDNMFVSLGPDKNGRNSLIINEKELTD